MYKNRHFPLCRAEKQKEIQFSVDLKDKMYYLGVFKIQENSSLAESNHENYWTFFRDFIFDDGKNFTCSGKHRSHEKVRLKARAHQHQHIQYSTGKRKLGLSHLLRPISA
jgi:hypothetical protein